MRITQVHYQLVALLGSTVTYAVDLQLLGKALVNALYHVVDQCAVQTVHALGLFFFVCTGNVHNIAVHLYSDAAVDGFGKSDALTGYGNGIALYLHFDAGGDFDGLVANSAHSTFPPYQMNARTSPPTFSLRASLSVMTPLEVERIATPRPFMTLGQSSQLV